MNYLQKQAAREDAIVSTIEQITRQFDTDTLCCALKRWRPRITYDQVMELLEIWEQTRREYHGILKKTPEQDVHEEHLYRELLGVTKDPAKIIPHELRYPDLKRQDYRGRKEKRGR